MQQGSSTLYEYLQVSPQASEGVIRAAYKSLVQQWHPDRHPGDLEHAELMMIRLNQAYHVLSDDGMRTRYDQFLEDNKGLLCRELKFPEMGWAVSSRARLVNSLENNESSPGQIISVRV